MMPQVSLIPTSGGQAMNHTIKQSFLPQKALFTLHLETTNSHSLDWNLVFLISHPATFVSQRWKAET